jgi:hypothetical protein
MLQVITMDVSKTVCLLSIPLVILGAKWADFGQHDVKLKYRMIDYLLFYVPLKNFSLI